VGFWDFGRDGLDFDCLLGEWYVVAADFPLTGLRDRESEF